MEQLVPRLAPLGDGFIDRMRAYLMEPEDKSPARRILAAAHLFASYSEFLLLKNVNEMDEELTEIEASFIQGLEALQDLPGVAELLSTSSVAGRFARLCGKLRFQTRWSQTPRIPETSVLGHMFIVACFAWFFTLEQDGCRARKQNNFFCGLFHDLPELLTRDIISPVKRSAREIGDLIREYEEHELERLVLGPLSDGGYKDVAERLGYFLGLTTGSEFDSCVTDKGIVRKVDSEQVQSAMDRDEFDPKDGEMLKVCDNLAAFIEAYTALKNGIASDQLHEAQYRIRKLYQHRPGTAGIQAGALMADFD